MQEGSPYLFSIPSSAFIACRLFDGGHSDWCEMISHCSFDLHFYRNLEYQVHESKQIGNNQTEMARVNIDILGISELNWTGMGEFNSDDHYIYYCGQKYLRRNGVAITVNKRVQKAVLG